MTNAQGQLHMGHEAITEAGIGIAEFLLATLSIAFGAWSLALAGVRKDIKDVRADWLGAMDKLTGEICKLREELSSLGNRVTRVEVEQAHQNRQNHHG